MDSFEGYYRRSTSARADALKAGVVVFDANALLDLYRFAPEARREFLDLIRAVRDRVFVPYQIAWEFHRRRIDAVSGRTAEFDQQRKQLDDIQNRIRGLVRQLAQRAHAEASAIEELLEDVDDAHEDVRDFLKAVIAKYDLDPDELAASPPDSIVQELAEILTGRVADHPDEDVLVADRREAKRRIESKLPPGFADRGKEENASGDYLWWAEVVRYAREVEPEAVIIVSNDVRKGDWTYESRGFRIGPDPRLVEEMRAASGASLHWATTSDFLADMPAAIGSAGVSDTTVEEARVSRLVQDVVDAIMATVRSSDEPLVSSAVANAALQVDPSLSDTAWSGAGSFRSFLDLYVPELEFIIPPSPGYVLDPAIHSDSDVPSPNRSSRDSSGDRQIGQTAVWGQASAAHRDDSK